MATPNPRNLVLLLTSGHTVRVALRDDDLTGNGGPTPAELNAFLESMPAIVGGKAEALVFSYVEDPSMPKILETSGDDFRRITVEGPGTVVQYG